MGCSPWGLEESDTTEQLHFHFSSIAEYLKQKNESMSWKINWWKYLSVGPYIVKRMKRTEDSLRDLWDHVKHTNVRIIGVPEEDEKKKGCEKILEETIVENYPNMEK